MVGIIAKKEHITTQEFKAASDVIILAGPVSDMTREEAFAQLRSAHDEISKHL